MLSSIGQSVNALCDEHGIDRDFVIEAMKEAVKAAARKQFKSQGESIEVEWNDDEGIVEISSYKEVVTNVESPSTEMTLEEAQELAGDEAEIGDVLLIPLPTDELGRIAAQTAKQILVQKVREAVREKVYNEYYDRIGEVFHGQVKRFERGDMIVEFQANLEAVVPRKEQVRSDMWNINDRIRVVIKDVTKEPRGQQIIASRASAELLKRLFETEVPEIYDGTVVIKSAVREPGDRAKLAVTSNEKDVDPVGACVGMKGSRVQSVIKELRGEKIDIIEWSDEPSIFAANALSPAKVSQVRITDIEKRKMEVIVPEDQLSLAIGKSGQNVRLATKLVGWNIDIVSEELLKLEIAKQMNAMAAAGEAVPITAVSIATPNQVEILNDQGIDTIEKLAEMSLDDLVEMLDVSLDEAEKILASAIGVVEDQKQRASEVAAEEQAQETDSEDQTAENAETEETKAEESAEKPVTNEEETEVMTEETAVEENREDETLETVEEIVSGESAEEETVENEIAENADSEETGENSGEEGEK